MGQVVIKVIRGVECPDQKQIKKYKCCRDCRHFRGYVMEHGDYTEVKCAIAKEETK